MRQAISKRQCIILATCAFLAVSFILSDNQGVAKAETDKGKSATSKPSADTPVSPV
jgi:hypothetical protein